MVRANATRVFDGTQCCSVRPAFRQRKQSISVWTVRIAGRDSREVGLSNCVPLDTSQIAQGSLSQGSTQPVLKRTRRVSLEW